MAFELFIPKCTHAPAHELHSPSVERPLRINIEGPLVSIQRLLPNVTWHMETEAPDFPQEGGPALAKLTYETLYERSLDNETGDEVVIRDEYLGWVTESRPSAEIDYYGITFDHRVPPGDDDPDILQINIIETFVSSGPYADGLAYAKEWVRPSIGSEVHGEGKVPAIPRCCQNRKGTTDRWRTNQMVKLRDGKITVQEMGSPKKCLAVRTAAEK
ncbi:MAG: hypothetical protein M1821_000572 [Bathelium mastoideum]|nr:MAG: hypothetical protein M1821_000572 [Bathelium mastoideum]